MYRNKFSLTRLVVPAVLIGLATFMSAPAFAQSAQSSAPEMSPAQRLAIEKVIGEYLRENPEVVIEAIRTFQARQQTNQQQQQRASVASLQKELETDPTSPVVGNKNGNVTIVEFFDYRCHFCKQVFPSVVELLKKDTNIRYVLKEFPILSPGSQIAARAALVVWKNDPAKYFDYHSDLMESHGALTERKVLRMAAKYKLNTDRMKREMNSQEISGMLQRNFDLAKKLGIRGTPGFIVAGTLVPGAIDLKTLRRMVADARKGKKPTL